MATTPEKYTQAPWHDAKQDKPSFGGAVCMCYNAYLHCEMRMIFHRSRPDSGYEDFFTAELRSYDYHHITYWAYYPEWLEANTKPVSEFEKLLKQFAKGHKEHDGLYYEEWFSDWVKRLRAAAKKED